MHSQTISIIKLFQSPADDAVVVDDEGADYTYKVPILQMVGFFGRDHYNFKRRCYSVI